MPTSIRPLSLLWATVALAVAGCDLIPEVEIPAEDTTVETTEESAPAELTVPALHGIVIVGTDYVSTELYAANTSTAELSPVFLDSGTVAPELSTALSGDVILASTFVSTTTEIVVIDRFNSVLTFLDAQRSVTRQISVGTAAYGVNPYGYIRLSETKAYVSRYGSVFDGSGNVSEGDDILVINTKTGDTITRIDLSEQLAESDSTTGTTHPNVSELFAVEGYVYAVLENSTDDYSGNGDAVIVVVDATEDTITHRLAIPGTKNCNSGAYDRQAKRVYVACIGSYAGDQLAESGILVLDTTNASTPALVRKHAAADIADGAALTGSMGLVGSGRIAYVAFGATDFATGSNLSPETIWVLTYADAATATAAEIFSVNEAYTLSIQTDANHARIFVADANTAEPAVHVLELAATGSTLTRQIHSVTGDRLPPRGIHPY